MILKGIQEFRNTTAAQGYDAGAQHTGLEQQMTLRPAQSPAASHRSKTNQVKVNDY